MFAAPKDIRGPNLFRMFVDELGGPKAVCRYLDVSIYTVRRWLKHENAPRVAVLALFWESRYGRSQIFTSQVNEIRLLYRRVELLQRQYTRAKDIVTGLRRLHSGTANEPLFEELEALHELPPNPYEGPDAALDPSSPCGPRDQPAADPAAPGTRRPPVSPVVKKAATALHAQTRSLARQ